MCIVLVYVKTSLFCKTFVQEKNESAQLYYISLEPLQGRLYSIINGNTNLLVHRWVAAVSGWWHATRRRIHSRRKLVWS